MLFKFHKALVDRTYRLLFSSSGHRRKPGPKGPSAQLTAAMVEMKRRNPKSGCMRIAQQIANAFGVEIDKDVVRRVLAKHYRPDSGTDGPSWLSLIAQLKDSLWSIDLRCESILLRRHWILVVMDVFTRRVIGFGVEPAHIDGVSICRMFNRATAGQLLRKHLSTDHDPLFRFHRPLAYLRVIEIEEIKTVPYAPVSHPFVEWIESAPDRGTTVHLYFPAIEAPAQTGTPAPAITTAPRGSGQHVLYLDDEEALVLLVTRMLERLDYQVSGYTEAEAALDAPIRAGSTWWSRTTTCLACRARKLRKNWCASAPICRWPLPRATYPTNCANKPSEQACGI